IDKYGLKALAGLIRMENNNQTKVAIGFDLNKLNDLSDLGPGQKLSSKFRSPWLETTRSDVIPAYKLPKEIIELNRKKRYFLPPVATRMNKLNEDTLFYLFYTKPKDVLQEFSYRELHGKGWRFHKELKVFLIRDPTARVLEQTAEGMRTVFIFFDFQSWIRVKKEFVVYYNDL
ncbi:CCR4-NOT core subunit CDC36, partial [Ascoidea rubescens DSM 1968]